MLGIALPLYTAIWAVEVTLTKEDDKKKNKGEEKKKKKEEKNKMKEKKIFFKLNMSNFAAVFLPDGCLQLIYAQWDKV